VKVLVDTHIFLWLMTEPERLVPAIRSACQDEENQLVLSVVSLWEIQIKVGLGKLTLHLPLRQILDEQTHRGAFELLPVLAEHVLALDSLPAYHQDPFDRLLIAQAIAENLLLASQDAKIAAYSATVPLVM
jgi:PIN domain nuclease of toxin-antitoxin system